MFPVDSRPVSALYDTIKPEILQDFLTKITWPVVVVVIGRGLRPWLDWCSIVLVGGLEAIGKRGRDRRQICVCWESHQTDK